MYFLTCKKRENCWLLYLLVQSLFCKLICSPIAES